MDCILHIGIHKTGSSSIQSSLADYDDGDTFYAQMGNPNQTPAFNLMFSKNPYEFPIWRKRGLSRAEVDEAKEKTLSTFVDCLKRSDRNRVVFSAEGLSQLSFAEVKTAIDLLQEHCNDIKVVAYVRDPTSFAISLYQQRLKGGQGGPLKVISPRFKHRLGSFLKILGKDAMDVRIFDRKELYQGDVVSDFCQAIGLSEDHVTHRTANESVPVGAMKILYHFNRRMPLYFGDTDLTKARHRFIRALGYATKDTGKPPTEIFSALSDPKDHEWLKDNFGIEFANTQDKVPMRVLREYLKTIEPELIEALLGFLKENGQNNEYDRDPVKIASKIYFMCLINKGFSEEAGKVIQTPPNK